MAIQEDNRPRDVLGRPTRPVKYPHRRHAHFSQDAVETLDEMATVTGMKVGKLIRRAVMKDIYIYKAKHKKEQTDGK